MPCTVAAFEPQSFRACRRATPPPCPPPTRGGGISKGLPLFREALHEIIPLGDLRTGPSDGRASTTAKGRKRMGEGGGRTPWWAWTWPVLAWAILAAAMVFGTGSPIMPALAGAILIATVFAAVFHAETIAHRIGEPFGTLVLAVAVTIIEVA